MNIATKLSEARKLIERGWTQFDYRDGRGVCAVGALAKVLKQTPAKTERGLLYMALQRGIAAVDPSYGDLTFVSDWNDAPERTQAEVIEAFKRAEQLARDSAE